MAKSIQKNESTPAWLDKWYWWTLPLRERFDPVKPSLKAGMGAVPDGSGKTTFRVWAPHAQRVFVTGTFNKWSLYRSPLTHEADGYWSAEVPQVGVGDEYKFVIQRNGRTVVRTDPYARDVTVPFSNSVVRNGYPSAAKDDAAAQRPATPFVPPPLHELVIYELHVGTFAETLHGPPGDFYGVIDKLPYLHNLGVNAIELMPVKAFPGDFSWGYNPAHPFAVSRVYGGAEGLKKLVAATHAHGVAVIVDVVYNHFGPGDLSLWQFDGWQQDGKGGIYFYNDWRSKTPWADTRPDYGRSEVRQYIRDNVMMWFEEFGVDGLRWDATSYIRNAHGHDGDPGADIAEGWQMMAAINAEVNGRFPQAINIAEDLQSNGWLTKETADGGAGFHTQWDANFVHPVRQAIIAVDDDARDMHAVAEAIRFRYNDAPFQRVIYTESHDEVANGKARVPEEITPGDAGSLFAQKRSALGAVLVFTAPGVPMIFQGQEFLEDGWFDDQRPLDWLKAYRYAENVALYRDLIRLRRNLDGVSQGLTGPSVNVFRIDQEQKVIAFHRWLHGGAGDDVVVIANFSHRPLQTVFGFPHGGLWRVRFDSNRKRYHPQFGAWQRTPDVIAQPGEADGLAFHAAVLIGPYASLVLSQDA